MCNNIYIGNIYQENNISERDYIYESKRPKTELKVQAVNIKEGNEENDNNIKLSLESSEKAEINNLNILKDDNFAVVDILNEYKNLKRGKSKMKPPQPLNYALILKEDSYSNLSESSNYLSKKLDTSQTNIKPRHQYLFYKTPKEHEKKRFDFTEENINYMFTAN